MLFLAMFGITYVVTSLSCKIFLKELTVMSIMKKHVYFIAL
jgi:hypothetical protein